MATVNIAFVRPHILNGAVVAASGDVESESITSSGTSQATDIAADNQKVLARIAVSGGSVWVTFAAAPTAATEWRNAILAGRNLKLRPDEPI